MKIMQLMIAFLLVATIGNAQKSVDKMFDKYSKQEGVYKMNLTGDVLNLLDEELTQGIGSKIDNIDILILSDGNKIAKQDYMTIKADLRASDYEELMNARDNGTTVQVFVREQGEIIKNLFMMVKSDDDQNILVKLKGDLKLEDFQNIDLSSFDGLGMLSKIGGN